MDLEHEKRLTEVESRSKSNTKRLDDVEKRQDNLDKLVVSVEALAVKEQNVENDVKEIKTDVKSLTNKPGQRWESFVTSLISIVLGAVAGYIFAQIGLKG